MSNLFSRLDSILALGYWAYEKYTRQAVEDGSAYRAAKNMRKQGIPISVALLVLAGSRREFGDGPKETTVSEHA